MTRGIDSATQTELDKSAFNIINLLEFQGIGGSNTYITDAPVNLDYSGNTYDSVRGMLGVSDIQEEENIKIENVDITLSGVDIENVKLFLDYDYIDRRVLIHRVVMNSSYAFVGSPILVFDGRLDQPRLVEDFEARTATLSVSASSHWSDFQSINGRHTNPTEHKVLYSGDTFFDKATETQKDVKWGKE
tara:strand:+ start:2911 stop:3477 length:567 start_codon:yes stop_codon:yes gene_type:complete